MNTTQNMKVINARISVELEERIREMAFERSTARVRVTLSDIVREALELYLKQSSRSDETIEA